MNRRNLGSILLGAAIMFAAGVYVGGNRGGGAKTAGTVSLADDSALATLREENRRASEQLDQLRSSGAADWRAEPVPDRAVNPEQSVRGEWRALANLKRQKIAQPQLTVLDRPAQLHDTFATLFELSQAERDALQRAVDRASETLAGLEAENATVSRDEKGIVTIVVKPFPDAGGFVYDELMKAFAATLGDERYGAFLALGARQVEWALANCGAQERTLRISHDPRREKMPYIVRDEIKMGPKERDVTTSTFQRRNEIPARLGTVARLLPPEPGVER